MSLIPLPDLEETALKTQNKAKPLCAPGRSLSPSQASSCPLSLVLEAPGGKASSNALCHGVLVLPSAGPPGKVGERSPGGVSEDRAGAAGAGGANAEHQGDAMTASASEPRLGARWVSPVFLTRTPPRRSDR